MTWNTARWLSGRMAVSFTVDCLSFPLCLSLSLCARSISFTLSLSLSSMTFKMHLICVKNPVGHYPCK